MLLGPQGFEKVGDPAVDRPQSVQARMAGAAEGDQSGRGDSRDVRWWTTSGAGAEADAAGAAVALEHLFAASGEAAAVAAVAVVAPLAQPAAVEIPGSAGAAQRQLLVGKRGAGGHGAERREGIMGGSYRSAAVLETREQLSGIALPELLYHLSQHLEAFFIAISTCHPFLENVDAFEAHSIKVRILLFK